MGESPRGFVILLDPAYVYTLIAQTILYAHTRMVIRIYAYSYMYIRIYLYAYTCTSDVSLLFRTKNFLCVSFRGGGGALPYIGYIGMCHCEG